VTAGALATDPILGWRLWHVSEDGQLSSWARSAVWPERRRMEASCRRAVRRSCAEPPVAGHACGIYAARTRDLAEALLDGLPPLHGPFAVGLVSLWGRVVENVDGWRAQYAYPYELHLVGRRRDLAAKLRAGYAVDVVHDDG
jgi:hypothetical protein